MEVQACCRSWEGQDGKAGRYSHSHTHRQASRDAGRQDRSAPASLAPRPVKVEAAQSVVIS
uniref:Uncharacterized protein n=1 Tax=Oryza glumipatula TaxID=40148 RepID=A0A0E0ANC5_9ORYZ